MKRSREKMEKFYTDLEKKIFFSSYFRAYLWRNLNRSLHPDEEILASVSFYKPYLTPLRDFSFSVRPHIYLLKIFRCPFSASGVVRERSKNFRRRHWRLTLDTLFNTSLLLGYVFCHSSTPISPTRQLQNMLQFFHSTGIYLNVYWILNYLSHLLLKRGFLMWFFEYYAKKSNTNLSNVRPWNKFYGLKNRFF
jgi:hypothetical protein